MERDPWWKRVTGPFPSWEGPAGCKPDGGGCHVARGRVGPMTLHRAAHNQDAKGWWVGCGGWGRREREREGACPLAQANQNHHHPFLPTPTLLSPALAAALAAGANPNEVEAAGNTPLHCAAYGGWEAGVRALVSAGAKVAASNNAGDRAWHWAVNMGHAKVAAVLVEVSRERGRRG